MPFYGEQRLRSVSGRLRARGRSSLEGGVGETRGEQKQEDSGDAPGSTIADLDQPPEVDDGGDGGDVDEAMKTLPGLAAHGTQHGGRAGEGEREQDEPGEEADLDEATLLQIVPDAGPDQTPLCEELAGMTGGGGVKRARQVVAGEEKDVGGEVEGGVEEGVEADKAAEADEEAETGGETAGGRDAERAEQDPERPVAGEMGDVVDGIGIEGERSVFCDEEQVKKGRNEAEMEDGFKDEDGLLGHRRARTGPDSQDSCQHGVSRLTVPSSERRSKPRAQGEIR